MKYFGKICLVLGLFGVSLLLSQPATAETWYELKSDNFIVYSNADQEDSYKLVEQLEYFRFFLQFITNVKDSSADIPLTIFLLKKGVTFRKLTGVGKGVLGFYLTHPRGTVAYAYISGFGGGSQPGRQVLFHEYVHHFMLQFSPFEYPKWFHEGFAEYLGAFRYEDGKILVGKAVLERVRTLRASKWLDMEALLASNRWYSDEVIRKRATSMFYAQSWFLVHYLQTNPERRKQLQEYIRLMNNGVPFEEAFEQTFQISMEQLGEELLAYGESGKISYMQYTLDTLGENDFKPEITVRELTEREADFMWIKAKTYLVSDTRLAWARKNMLREEIKKGEYKWEARILLAEMELFTDKIDDAEELVELIHEYKPETNGLYSVQGGVMVEKAMKMQPGPERDQMFFAARDVLRYAIEKDEKDVLGHYYLGISYVYGPEGDLREATTALDNALNLLPQIERTRLEKSLLYLKLGFVEDALYLFKMLSLWSASEEIHKTAEFCIEEIETNGNDHACNFLNRDSFKE